MSQDKFQPSTPFEKVVINNLDIIKGNLAEHSREMTQIKREITATNAEVTTLKGRASMWGAVSGALTGLFLGFLGIK